ncbi:hypothetical protein BJY04DRAFT_200672 [Aspergillus karnatakaensis]|uniref:uncharacterized protein n=1 Tax=Aspergillus karnatakaensis TaxID=1810916 RepID=UPI003CCDB246
MSADNAPEHQIDDLEREDATLLQKTPSSAVELDGIPAVRAAGYGNWTWAEQRCCRRNGLTREQVEMVHKLSQIYKDGGDIIEFYTFLLEKLIPMAQSSLPNLASDPRHRTQSFFFRVSYALTSERSIKPLGTGRFNLDSLSAKLDQLHGMTAPDPLTLLSVSSATISALDFVNARVRIKAATQELSSFYRLLETSKQLLEFLHREMIADQALDKTQEHPGNQEQSRLSSKHAAQQAVKTGNDTKTVEPDLISLESSTKKELCRNPQDQLQQDSQTTNNPTVRHTRFRGYNYDQAKLDSLVHDLISSQLRAEDGPPQRYIVIGRFPKGSPNPIEATTNFLSNGEDLFPKIRKQARSIRGWQNYFSLKTLKRFSLYQVLSPSHKPPPLTF